MSFGKFISSSVLLFIDTLLVASTNWVYWLIISKIASTSDIGHATTVYNVILLATTLTQLGLEYPLLKKASVLSHRSQIFGTTLIIQLAITTISIPLVIYTVNNLYGGALQVFVWISLGLLLLSPLVFVTRFTLLGISNAKNVLVIDTVGTIAKFLIAYTLVSMGFGAFGILISFLLQSVLMGSYAFAVVKKWSFGSTFGGFKYVKEIIKDGFVNTPAKLSRTLIFSLSVVLLGSLGVNSSEIGIFYVTLMISLVVGGLASSIAYMVIPASAATKTDLSASSVRLSLSLTVPIISVLIIAPRYILSLIGPQYVSAETTLLVLSIGILPYCIVMNTISKFNNLGNSRKLISIGIVQISVFLVSFLLLVPHYGTLGGAFSMLVALVASSIFSISWSDRMLVRYIYNSCAAVAIGVGAGYAISLVIGRTHPLGLILISFFASLAMIFALKNTSTSELKMLVRSMVRKGDDLRVEK